MPEKEKLVLTGEVSHKEQIKREPDTAVYSLWFGLNYGSILTAFALYKALERLGKSPVLLQKPKELWTEHYADKGNISGLFIYENCRVLEVFDNPEHEEIFKNRIDTYITGSDVIWSRKLLGETVEYFMQRGTDKDKRKISVSSSFGSVFDLDGGLDNEYYHFLRRYNAISAADEENAQAIRQYFDLHPKVVLDPVFLCDKQAFISCADTSAAKKNERMNSFIFASVENGDKRKKAFILRGNDIMLHNKGSFLRCMIDINRFPESKEALGIEPAFFIRVEDYLYYLINSEFVLTDNIYAMYLALIFEKPFAVIANKDDPDLYRFRDFLSPLGLEERIVILQDDLKTKEYLFRKPVRYQRVNQILDEMKQESFSWLKSALGIEDRLNDTDFVKQGEI